MNKLKKFLFAIWELPQNALGFIVTRIFYTHEMTMPNNPEFNNVRIFAWNVPGGMSLGKYIFIYEPAIGTSYGDCTIKHEYGHTIQSKYLGWLYLLVIGLPSLGWAWLGKGYRKKTGKSYYSFYTERWADKLGGVVREDTNVPNT